LPGIFEGLLSEPVILSASVLFIAVIYIYFVACIFDILTHACGLWLVACGLWLVACGLLLVACGFYIHEKKFKPFNGLNLLLVIVVAVLV
jgi:hypothetical protein